MTDQSEDVHNRMTDVVLLSGFLGAGKTTLLRCLGGLLLPLDGHLRFESKPLSTIPTRELAKQVALVQQFNRIDFDFTVTELVMIGRFSLLCVLESDNYLMGSQHSLYSGFIIAA